MDAIAIGTVLNERYRVEAELGEGGMGRVYRCEDRTTGTQVAVKVLRPELGRNADAARRFEREATVSMRLEHSNIVGVQASGVLGDGTCYLVMELLDGESLAARLERERCLPWRDAVEITRGVIRGLGHAHLHGVIHRDIKPDNVFLVRAKSGVKLLDFGIAKLLDAGDGATTRNGITIGTPAYLSPEQAIGGAVTHASDLYSATVVLFEMLTGSTPFAGLQPVEMVFAHVSKPVPSLADLDVDAPLALVELVERGLEKRAADRIASAAAYIEALDGVCAGPPVDAPRTASISLTATVAQRPPGRDPIRAAAIVALGEAPTARVSYPTTGPLPTGGLPPPRPALAQTSAMRKPRLPRLSPPRRRRWLPIASAMFAVAAIIGGLAGFASRSRGEASAAALPAPAPQPIAPTPPSVATPAPTLDESLHQLRRGKTCSERRAAIARLVEIGDARAVTALRKAKSRSRANACLVADAEEAIWRLAP